MTAKQIIVLVVGILALGVTAWKGPSAWAGVSTGITAIALLVGTLSIVPKKDQEYIQDLEDALTKQQQSPSADPSAITAAIPAGPSRERFSRRVVRL